MDGQVGGQSRKEHESRQESSRSHQNFPSFRIFLELGSSISPRSRIFLFFLSTSHTYTPNRTTAPFPPTITHTPRINQPNPARCGPAPPCLPGRTSSPGTSPCQSRCPGTWTCRPVAVYRIDRCVWLSVCISLVVTGCAGESEMRLQTTHPPTHLLPHLAGLGDVLSPQLPCLALRGRRLLDRLLPAHAPHLILHPCGWSGGVHHRSQHPQTTHPNLSHPPPPTPHLERLQVKVLAPRQGAVAKGPVRRRRHAALQRLGHEKAEAAVDAPAHAQAVGQAETLEVEVHEVLGRGLRLGPGLDEGRLQPDWWGGLVCVYMSINDKAFCLLFRVCVCIHILT